MASNVYIKPQPLSQPQPLSNLRPAQSLPQPVMSVVRNGNGSAAGSTSSRLGRRGALLPSHLFTRTQQGESDLDAKRGKEPEEQDRATAPGSSALQAQMKRVQSRGARGTSMPGGAMHEGDGDRSSNHSGGLHQPGSPPSSTASGASHLPKPMGRHSNRIAPLPPPVASSCTTRNDEPVGALFARRSQSDTPQIQGGGIMVRPPPSPLGRRGSRKTRE